MTGDDETSQDGLLKGEKHLMNCRDEAIASYRSSLTSSPNSAQDQD